MRIFSPAFSSVLWSTSSSAKRVTRGSSMPSSLALPTRRFRYGNAVHAHNCPSGVGHHQQTLSRFLSKLDLHIRKAEFVITNQRLVAKGANCIYSGNRNTALNIDARRGHL